MPLVGSTVDPMVVIFLPLMLITGVTGTFFRALAITMAAALMTSLALALTWTPTLSQYFVRRQTRSARRAATTTQSAEHPPETRRRLMEAEEASVSGWMRRIIERYERLLQAGAGASLLAHLVCACAGRWPRISATTRSAPTCCPQMDEGEFVLDYMTPPGASLDETNRAVEKAIDNHPHHSRSREPPHGAPACSSAWPP